MDLIGFTGRKSSGKDAAANPLVTCGFVRVKFADGLKTMLRSLYQYAGLSKETIDEFIEGSSKEAKIDILDWNTSRWAMQSLGTEWGRNCISQNLWTKITRAHLEKYDRAVITDVRFPNEAEMIKKLGGVLVRIRRPGCKKVGKKEHPSEALIDDLTVDHEIINSGSIEELHQQVLKML